MRLRHLAAIPVLASLVACGGGDDTTPAPDGVGLGGSSAGGSSGGKAGAAGKSGSGTGGTTGGSSGAGGTGGSTGGSAGKGGGTGGKGGTGGTTGGSAGASGVGGSTGGKGGTGGTTGGSAGAAAGKGGAAGATGGSAGSGGGVAGSAGNAGSGGSVGGSAGATGGSAGAGGSVGGSAGSGGVAGSAGAAGGVAGSAGTGGSASATCTGMADGTACSDGDACTLNDVCMAGACVPGAAKTCAPLDSCHDAGTCDSGTGQCTTPAKADGATCNDGDQCTQTDVCMAGVCKGGNPVVCPSDQCHTAGTCTPATGMCTPEKLKPNLTPCDDGNPCTVSDSCLAGACNGTAKACPWSDACNVGSCNANSGACETKPVANGGSCSDGSVCTSGDVCTAGACVPGAAVCTGTTVVISELRTRGSGGAGDEFVEIWNTTAAAIDISGWKLRASSNGGTLSDRATVPANTMLPAFAHYLITNTGYGNTPMVTANLTYGTGIADDGGIAITLGNNTIVDQVGLSAGSGYKEGTPLAGLTMNLDVCYERRPGSGHGSPIDTGNNSTDFFASGGCDPQNLASELTPAFSHAPKVLFFPGLNGAAVQATTTLTNTLAGNLTIASGAIGGANAAEFSFAFASGVPHVMATGTTFDVTVTHTPAASGLRTATLLVTTGGGETQAIDLFAGDAPLPSPLRETRRAPPWHQRRRQESPADERARFALRAGRREPRRHAHPERQRGVRRDREGGDACGERAARPDRAGDRARRAHRPSDRRRLRCGHLAKSISGAGRGRR
jgi:hypothetical protein